MKMRLKVVAGAAGFLLLLLGCQSTRPGDDMMDDHMAKDAMMDDTMSDDEMMEDDTMDDSMSDDAMMEDDMMDDSMSDDEMMADDMMDDSMASTAFDVTISVLAGSPTPLAPVAWAVHTGHNPFVVGDMGHRLSGLESLAEDGDPAGADAALSMLSNVSAHGIASTPIGGVGPGPAAPGSGYKFTAEVHHGEKLSFATMYVESNDLFYTTGTEGVVLYDMDAPIAGDITDMILLYDAGTEVNEEPGVGMHQPMRQSGPNSGMDEMGHVAPVQDSDAMYMYPGTGTVIRVTVAPHDTM